jgi:hypothetical protein
MSARSWFIISLALCLLACCFLAIARLDRNERIKQAEEMRRHIATLTLSVIAVGPIWLLCVLGGVN